MYNSCLFFEHLIQSEPSSEDCFSILLVKQYLKIPMEVQKYIEQWVKPISDIEKDLHPSPYLYLDNKELGNLSIWAKIKKEENIKIALSFLYSHNKETYKKSFSDIKIGRHKLRGELANIRLYLMLNLYQFSKSIQQQFENPIQVWLTYEASLDIYGIINPANHTSKGKRSFFKGWTETQRNFEATIRGEREYFNQKNKELFDKKLNTYRQAEANIIWIQDEIQKFACAESHFDKSLVQPFLKLVAQERNRERESTGTCVPAEDFTLKPLSRGRPQKNIK